MINETIPREVPPLQINNMPQAIVAATGVVATAGIIVALALAGWSSEAIIAFGGLAASMVVGQVVAARKASVVEAKTDQQTNMLETVVKQTNGVSTEERQEIADRAAIKAIRMYRDGA
jgi:hypothetical protein